MSEKAILTILVNETQKFYIFLILNKRIWNIQLISVHSCDNISLL